MYTEQDFTDITSQFKERLTATCVPACLGLAGVVASLIFRIEWLTTLLTILTGAYSLVMYYFFLFPVIAYRTHLNDVLHGRVRTMTGSFQEMEELAVLRDGVYYYPMMLNVGDPNDPEDDRLLYYDANLPRPDWKVGDMLTVTIHDKALGAWERA